MNNAINEEELKKVSGGESQEVTGPHAVVDDNVCIGCGSCIGVCPVEAIHMSDSQTAYVDAAECVGCGGCADTCPTGAIQIK
jgi:Fe-S-cluster-containing hydrogenase component 2